MEGRSTATTMIGQPVSMPVAIAPTGLTGMQHADGEIAAAHGLTPAQVMLRWQLQRGRQVIPKSVNPERIRENLDVFGFELTEDELEQLDALNTGKRSGPEPHQVTLEDFGKEIPEA